MCRASRRAATCATATTVHAYDSFFGFLVAPVNQNIRTVGYRHCGTHSRAASAARELSIEFGTRNENGSQRQRQLHPRTHRIVTLSSISLNNGAIVRFTASSSPAAPPAAFWRALDLRRQLRLKLLDALFLFGFFLQQRTFAAIWHVSWAVAGAR